MVDEKKEHGRFGYVTCVPNERMGRDPFWENVGHALVGLIPLRIWELRATGEAELMELSVKAADVIGSRGDEFQFPSRRGRPTGVLAELATGFAAVALLADGGITAIGVHACFYEHDGCPKNRDR